VIRILALETTDVRFPTSAHRHGSDAMNPDPDYSAATCVLSTSVDRLQGHGLTFTIGRGNEICCAAIRALAPLVVGLTLEEIQADMAGFYRRIVGDSQLRWLGPEKGVIHLAAAAVINAVWDLWGKAAEKPVWRLVSEMSPQQIVGLVDFRHILDVLTPDEAVSLLRRRQSGRAARERAMLADGLPAYTTSAGWLGYGDEKVRELCRQAVAEGWKALKFKVGRDTEHDLERCRIARHELGPHRRVMIDANQVWEVDEAIARLERLAAIDPWWIEEPISPDDVLGLRKVAEAVRPMRVATGEHCHNRVMWKQFFQAQAVDVVQIDACRLGGLNENIAVMLMAAKFDKPVCPHAGGVGLCEYVQHLGAIDNIAIGGERDDRMLEYAGHLHEHFVDRLEVQGSSYRPSESPGFGVEFKPESVAIYRFPDGAYWRERA
jgi:L-fuconate dehydratase